MLKEILINTISTEYESVEEIWRKVNDGLHQRSALERTLRALQEQGVIEKDPDSRTPRYRKRVRQLSI